MYLPGRSIVFLLGFCLLSFCSLSWAIQCAVRTDAAENLLYSAGTNKWYLEETRVFSREGYCMITFEENCDIRLGSQTTNGLKSWGCELVGKSVRCLCSGRMCNIDVKNFHLMAKTYMEKLQTCVYKDVPALKTALKDIVLCVQSNDAGSVASNNITWTSDVREQKSQHVCGVWFKEDCQVLVYVASIGYGPKYLNRCAKYYNDGIWCECTDDYCNANMTYWLEQAKTVPSNVKFDSCNYKGAPIYQIKTSTAMKTTTKTTTKTRKPFVSSTTDEKLKEPVLCGFSEFPFFTNSSYTPLYTTYVSSKFPCSIFFTDYCTIILGHATSNKKEECRKIVDTMGNTEFECFCAQRMCNFDFDFFLKQMKDLGDDKYRNCDFQKAPYMRAMSPTQKCYTGNRLDGYRYHSGVFKKSGKDWRKPADSVTETTEKGCTIVFKKDCEVILSPASKNYGAITFNTCAADPNHLSESIVCQCFDWDNCNVDIKKWLKEAENVGIKDWKCDWDKDNIPEYYVFPPTTPRPTTRVSRLFIEYTPATAGEMGNPPIFPEEETVPTTTQVAAVYSIYVGVLFCSFFVF